MLVHVHIYRMRGYTCVRGRGIDTEQAGEKSESRRMLAKMNKADTVIWEMGKECGEVCLND